MGWDPVRLTQKIRSALAPCSLGDWPTPLEPAPDLGRALGVAALMIKREDRSSVRCGGNKLRGLEFLLAGAPAGTVFVTVGGTGSTHCLATAVHAAAVSCRAAVAHFPQPDTAAGRAVAAACNARAALVVRARTRLTVPLAVLKAWRGARTLGPRRWIPGGGAHPRAVVGHLLAGLELGEQVHEPPDAIVLPLGTGGTAAGLVLAVMTLGWPTRVVAVRVAPAIVANRWRTLRLACSAAALLARHGIMLPPLPPLPPLLVVDGLGEGYGHPSAAGERARAIAAEHGLTLDPTYGAKAFAFLMRRATWDVQRAVFWHTFGAPVPGSESAR
ncbi:MAG TPA: pyridoxal-phosphate dependent enzyme [Gemmatimonadales bacterium]|nr:pyridoxal-phosphate dependent enzyme [Gemmatimonadales bacterium]